MGRAQVVGDLVSNWRKFAEGRPTLCFAPTIENSVAFVASCIEAGIPAAHIEANTKDDERRRVLRELELGNLKIVSNVGILCTGVDLPFVSCILLYRPTKSLNLYVQQCGRGTRPSHGKQDFIVIDHANNVREHGFIEDEREVFLDGIPKSKKAFVPPIKVCEECYHVCAASVSLCPNCGYAFSVEKSRAPEHVDGELAEVTVDDVDLKVRAFIKETHRKRKARGFKYGWAYHQLRLAFGEEVANRYMPKKQVPDWVPRKPTAASSTKYSVESRIAEMRESGKTPPAQPSAPTDIASFRLALSARRTSSD